MNNQVLSEIVLRSLLNNPQKDKVKGVEIISDCPFCGKEKHFFINSKTNLWNCKRCGREGNLKSFLLGIGKGSYLKELPNNFSLGGGALGKVPSLLLEKEFLGEEVTELKKIRFPVGFERIYEDKYLKNRGFREEDFYFHPVGYTDLEEKYKDYILIGITEGSEVKGYVGRYTKKIIEEKQLRYKNSKGTKFSNLLFNINSINSFTEIVFLVEGIFDAVNMENVLELKKEDRIKVLATFGKKISEKQILKLKSFSSLKTVILIYDGRDAVNEIKKYSFELSKNGFKVLIGFSEKGDPGSWSEKMFKKVLKNLESPEEFYYSRLSRIREVY